jgi:predicted nucleotidyltransferase
MKGKDLGEALSHLPGDVRFHLDTMKRAFVEHLGPSLKAIVLHGSVVRGGYDPLTSDIDVFVVLHSDDRHRLAAIGPALDVARAAARVACVFFRHDELTHAADVFPLLFEDVSRCHALLHGEDPFTALSVSPLHRCLRIEQELRDLRVRLRRLLTLQEVNRPVLSPRLKHKVKQMRSPLLGLLRERGEEPGTEGLDDVLAACTTAWGVDTKPLLRVDRDVMAAADAIAALLDAAIADVDARGKNHAEGR